MKPKTKLWSGAALIGAGAAAIITASLVWTRHQAEIDASAHASAALSSQALASQRSQIEAEAARAAALQPLNAAVDDDVNGATLIDLFDDEDWWQPYRTLVGARLFVGDGVRASWRPVELSASVLADLVKTARRQRPASALLTVGNQPMLLGGAQLTGVSDGEPVLVLVRRYEAPPVVAPPAPSPVLALATPPLPWIAGGTLVAIGLVLLLSGRSRNRKFDGSHNQKVDSSRTIASAHVPWQSVTTEDPGATPMPTPAPGPSVNPPRTFGRYRLLDRLGEGGMSEVYTAEAAGVEGFTRTFVLKRLRPELSRDKEAVAQFINEARTQASLVHSNIVPVFDFGVVEGEYYMTEEYIVGRDLTRLIGRHRDLEERPLDPRIALYIAHDTLQALSYAHGKRDRTGRVLNIVHRDVSPGNIIVSLAGEVKLSDFGIAKATSRVNSTQVGMVKGNANFMSPEQARGHAVDARSDLFSLGEVLYYCLTGELFYGGENDLDVLFKAATGPTEEHLERMRALPAADVLERALAFDPNDRFQTAAEFAEIIAPYTAEGKAQLMKLMPLLFGHELRYEAA